MYIERHEEVLRILAARHNVTVAELSRIFSVSEVTIRKDLTILEHKGCLLRTRGGARIAEDYRMIRSMNIRKLENMHRKQAIAKTARTLIRNSDVIYLDAGSTCQAIAREIRDMNIRVVTNSVDVISELSSAENIILSIIGGDLRRQSGAMVSPSAAKLFKDYQFSIAFIGTTGMTEDGLFSSQNILESEMKRQALQRAGKRVIAADSSKYPVRAFSVFADPDSVDILATDSFFPAAEQFEQLGIQILRAEIS